MKYVFVNLFFLGILFYTIHLSAEDEQDTQTDSTREIDPDYVPDWNIIIQEIERDAQNNSSWNY